MSVPRWPEPLSLSGPWIPGNKLCLLAVAVWAALWSQAGRAAEGTPLSGSRGQQSAGGGASRNQRDRWHSSVSLAPSTAAMARRSSSDAAAAATAAASTAATSPSSGSSSATDVLATLPPQQLVPGIIVGRGRYVLAEKLGDIKSRNSDEGSGGGTAFPWRRLPPPGSSQFLLEGALEEVSSTQAGHGLVPYKGLRDAIVKDLPQLPMAAYEAEHHRFLPAVHDFSVSFMQGDPFAYKHGRYRFGERLGRGAFGEAWRAVSLDRSLGEVVLKRLFVEKGEFVRLSGEREIFFGTMLQHRPHIARFIESFEEESFTDSNEGEPLKTVEVWLVFHNEGFSLTQHMFRVHPETLVVESSRFWWSIKQQHPLGDQVIKNIAYQLLHALAILHDMNITHRDIKGPNVFVTETWPPVVRLGDFGSALTSPPTDKVKALYGAQGPSEDEETLAFQPPEVVFADIPGLESFESRASALAEAEDHPQQPLDLWRSQSYDMWSFGALLLELVLGTRELFRVDERRWAKLERTLRQKRASPEQIEQAKHVQAMLDLCLAPNGMPREAQSTWFFTEGSPEQMPAAWGTGDHASRCTDKEFAQVLEERDLAGVGLASFPGRDLIRRLLAWSPSDRIRARDALAHTWFDDGAHLPALALFRGSSNPRSSDYDTEEEDEGAGQDESLEGIEEAEAFDEATDGDADADADADVDADARADADSDVDAEEEEEESAALGVQQEERGAAKEVAAHEVKRTVLQTGRSLKAAAEDACSRSYLDEGHLASGWATAIGDQDSRVEAGVGAQGEEDFGWGSSEMLEVADDKLLESSCLGLSLWAAASRNVGRRLAMEDRHAIHNLPRRCSSSQPLYPADHSSTRTTESTTVKAEGDGQTEDELDGCSAEAVPSSSSAQPSTASPSDSPSSSSSSSSSFSASASGNCDVAVNGFSGGSGGSLGAYFAVFDGHGGDRVSQLLRLQMHRQLVSAPSVRTNMSAALLESFASFRRFLEETERTPDGGAAWKDEVQDVAGSTALVGVVAGCHLHLANLGDCRAILARRWPQGQISANEDSALPHFSTSSSNDEALWPVGASVEIRETANEDLRGQRGVVLEVRSAAHRLYIVRLLRDGSLRPLKQSALRLLSQLQAVRLTEDHKPSLERERRRIEALGGIVEESGGSGSGAASARAARVAGVATSRSFGGSPAARRLLGTIPDIHDYILDPSSDMFMVMASDGVWDVLDDQAVADLVWEQVSSFHDHRLPMEHLLKAASDSVLQAALEKGSLDNLTCLIVLLSSGF